MISDAWLGWRWGVGGSGSTDEGGRALDMVKQALNSQGKFIYDLHYISELSFLEGLSTRSQLLTYTYPNASLYSWPMTTARAHILVSKIKVCMTKSANTVTRAILASRDIEGEKKNTSFWVNSSQDKNVPAKLC